MSELNWQSSSFASFCFRLRRNHTEDEIKGHPSTCGINPFSEFIVQQDPCEKTLRFQCGACVSACQLYLFHGSYNIGKLDDLRVRFKNLNSLLHSTFKWYSLSSDSAARWFSFLNSAEETKTVMSGELENGSTCNNARSSCMSRITFVYAHSNL